MDMLNVIAVLSMHFSLSSGCISPRVLDMEYRCAKVRKLFPPNACSIVRYPCSHLIDLDRLRKKTLEMESNQRNSGRIPENNCAKCRRNFSWKDLSWSATYRFDISIVAVVVITLVNRLIGYYFTRKESSQNEIYFRSSLGWSTFRPQDWYFLESSRLLQPPRDRREYVIRPYPRYW